MSRNFYVLTCVKFTFESKIGKAPPKIVKCPGYAPGADWSLELIGEIANQWETRDALSFLPCVTQEESECWRAFQRCARGMKPVNLIPRIFPFKTWEAKALGTRLYWKQSPAISSAQSTSLGVWGSLSPLRDPILEQGQLTGYSICTIREVIKVSEQRYQCVLSSLTSSKGTSCTCQRFARWGERIVKSVSQSYYKEFSQVDRESCKIKCLRSW